MIAVNCIKMQDWYGYDSPGILLRRYQRIFLGRYPRRHVRVWLFGYQLTVYFGSPCTHTWVPVMRGKSQVAAYYTCARCPKRKVI